MDNYLLDNYQKTGSNLETFKEHAHMIDENTSLVAFHSDDVRILSVLREPDKGYSVAAIEFGDWNCIADIIKGVKKVNLPVDYLKKNPLLAKEIQLVNKTIFYVETTEKRQLYLTSKIMNKTFSEKQSGLCGEFLKTSGLKRDIALSMQFSLAPIEGNLLIRKGDGYKKIFGFYSYKTKRFSLNSLYKSACEVKGVQKVRWTSNNEKTEIYLEFAEVNGYFPGMILFTSDTSYSQTGVTATLRKDGYQECFYLETWSNQQYSIDFTVDQMTDFVTLAMRYTADFMDRFQDILREKERIKLKTNEEYLDHMFLITEKISLKSMIGIKKYREIMKQLVFEHEYTEKEIIEDILDIVNNKTLSSNQIFQMKKALAKIASIV